MTDSLTGKYRNVRKKVDTIMSGYIARTKADEILEEGISQGKDLGGDEVRNALNYLFQHNRADEAMDAIRDKTLCTRILEEFRARESSKEAVTSLKS